MGVNEDGLDWHRKSCVSERGCDLGRLGDPFQDSEVFRTRSYSGKSRPLYASRIFCAFQPVPYTSSGLRQGKTKTAILDGVLREF